MEADGVIYSVSGKGSFISDDDSADAAILEAARSDFKMAIENAKSMGLGLDELRTVLNESFKGGDSDD